MKKGQQTREQWLLRAVEGLRPVFTHYGHKLPRHIRVSCGWPSKGAVALRRRVIGECWGIELAADKVPQIFISPAHPLVKTADPTGVLATLAHELVHVCVGKARHKGPFKKVMLQIGLDGKPTSTHAGKGLLPTLKKLAKRLGKYPHSALKPGGQFKVQGTRLIKIECGGCGYICRTTRAWLDTGLPTCCCGEVFAEAGAEE
jgi:hypothetical protein